MEIIRKKTYEAMRNVVEWSIEHVEYLPTNHCPENLLIIMGGGEPKATSEEAKKYWVDKTRNFYMLSQDDEVTSEVILNYQRIFLVEHKTHPYMKEIVDTLEDLISRQERTI